VLEPVAGAAPAKRRLVALDQHAADERIQVGPARPAPIEREGTKRRDTCILRREVCVGVINRIFPNPPQLERLQDATFYGPGGTARLAVAACPADTRWTFGPDELMLLEAYLPQLSHLGFALRVCRRTPRPRAHSVTADTHG
jgi:hypothetical protein